LLKEKTEGDQCVDISSYSTCEVYKKHGYCKSPYSYKRRLAKKYCCKTCGSGLSQATAMMLRAVQGRVKYLMAAQRSISSRIRLLEERQGNVILKMVRVFNNRSRGLQEQISGLERKISVSSNNNYKTLVHALRQMREQLANTTEMLQWQINRIVSVIPTMPPTREHTTMEPFNTAVPTMEPFVPTMEPFNTAVPTMELFNTAVPTMEPFNTAVPTMEPS